MTPTEEIYRGDEAKRILEHPLFKGAIENVKDGIVAAMSKSPMGDSETHNRLVIALQLLHQIEKRLMDHIETGKMAEIQLKDKNFLQRVVNF